MNKMIESVKRAVGYLKNKIVTARTEKKTAKVTSRRITGTVGRFIVRIVLYVIISIVFAVGIYHWNAQTLTGNRMPMPFGVGMSVVLSGSMEPELSANDLVFVKATDQYEVGDVIVYQSGDILVIHRIDVIYPDGETVVTKGDANHVTDDPINVSDIKGKMVGKIAGAGGIVTALRSPLGVVTTLAVAIALTVLSGNAEKKKQDERTAAVKEEICRLREELYPDSEKDEGDEKTNDQSASDDRYVSCDSDKSDQTDGGESS